MLGVMTTLLIIIYTTIILSTSFIGIKVVYNNNAMFHLAMLFFLNPLNNQVMHNYLLLKMLLSSCIIYISSLFISSNHFVISLDIFFLFSVLILILNQTLKLEKNFL